MKSEWNTEKTDQRVSIISWSRDPKNKMTVAEKNKKAREACGEYLLFLEEQIKVSKDVLPRLIEKMQGMDRPGVVGVRFRSNSMTEGEKDIVRCSGMSFKDAIRDKGYFIEPCEIKNEQAGECICILEEAFMIKHDVFEAIGGFDERYEYCFADVDLCLRLYGEKYKNYICDVYVYREEDQTSDTSADDAEYKSIERQQLRHDRLVFQGKWQRYLAKELYEDKLSGRGLFTEQKLTVAFAVSSMSTKTMADDYAKAMQLGAALEQRGCRVKFFSGKGQKDWYQIGVDTDVVVAMAPDYDTTKVCKCKNDLIRMAWITNADKESWRYLNGMNLIAMAQKDMPEEIKTENYENAMRSIYLPAEPGLFYDVSELEGKRREDRKAYLKSQREIAAQKGAYAKQAETVLQQIAGWFDVPIQKNEIDICGAMPDDESKKYWGDWHFALGMKRELEQLGYKVNVLPRDRWYDRSAAEYVLVLRGKRPYYRPLKDGRHYIMWNISHPEDVTIAEYDTYDYIFFASEKMHQELGTKIHVPSGVLLQCVDDTVMTCEETGEKRYELLFVGNSKEMFRPILQDLLPTEHHLAVYGRHWEPFPVQDYVVSDYLDNDKVGQAYHDAKILLNDHWGDMREMGIISNRIFDALAVGAFVISDEMPELDQLFEGNVVTYKNREDLKEKIDYYLVHDAEREAKAKAGQKIVLAGHTFRDRAVKIDHVIHEFL